MLCQFSVKNYRSIKEEVTLDMQAAALSEHKDHLLTCKDGENFLPVAVIYGPNGGGKTNVLRAINDILIKITAPICAVCPHNKESNCKIATKAVRINTFKFCEDSFSSPTEFEIFFRTNKSEYRYNIQLLNEEVVYESMNKRDIGKRKNSNLFVKDISAKNIFSMCDQFKEMRIPQISKDLPLLSYLAITYSENEIVKDILEWTMYKMTFINFAARLTEYSIYASMLKREKKQILEMLKCLDIDIENYKVLEIDDDILDIHTFHNVNEKITELDLFEEESHGTKKLFSVIPRVIKCLIDGSALVVDELDAKLHTKLLRHIIELFTNKRTNPKKAQLIFTSHDLSTMDNSIFRRDEIWFAAKNTEQATSLYSLAEFKDKSTGKSVRNDANFNKQYWEGRYGADPYLRKIIDWEVAPSEE